ncbi:MAG: DNA-formamidopyrimidine glycosylase family protein [Acidimicrobiia bacterium]
MPELPEVAALAERLDRLLVGAPLSEVAPIGFAALKTVEPTPESLLGRELVSVGHRGKYLVASFDGPRVLIHLGQGGRVDVEDPPRRGRPRGALVRLFFADRPSVLLREYGTERKAGWWVLGPGDDGPIGRLGPDATSAEAGLLIASGTDRRQLHGWLRDQRVMAGVGRGYADDALHRAGLSPYATLASLSEGQREVLREAVVSVLSEALGRERSRRGGLPARLDVRFAIHGRYGTPCPACGADLRRVSFESHEVTYCPDCQTGGRVLADRRMSRLVR